MASYAFVFIGRSGCGKGTQADLLQAFLKEKGSGPLLYIETGDLFREFIKGNSFSQKRSHEFYDSSIRQPDFLACHMWSHLLLSSCEEGTSVVFDGTPRSLAEAEVLRSAFSFFGFDTAYIIHLDVSRAWSENRLLSRGRADDQGMEKIQKRLDWYDKDVVPAVEYFKKDPSVVFVHVNGEQPVASVHSDIASSFSFLS